MENKKKLGAIALVTLLLGAAVGITVYYQNGVQAEALQKQSVDYEAKLAVETQKLAELQTALEAEQQDKAQLQADLGAVKDSITKLEDERARDEQILADYKVELDKLAAEKAEEQALKATSSREVLDDLALGAAVPVTTLDNNDLLFLLDGEIEFNDNDYDVQEKIILADLGIATSLSGDDDFADLPALVFNSEGAVQYRFIFDDVLNYTEVSKDEPLVLNLLGKEYRIIDVGAGEITVLDGKEFMVREGQTVEYAGKKIELLIVAENEKVYVAVDGQSRVIDEDDSEKVNGLDIYVEEVVYSGKESVQSVATLVVSDSDAERVIETGDEFVEGNELFEWIIGTSGDNLEYVGIDHVEKADDADESVLLPGDKLSFAGLFDIGYDYEKEYSYDAFRVDFDTATSNDIDSLRIRSLDGEKLILGDEELEEAWFDGTLVYYKNKDNDWVNVSNTTLYLENDDMSYAVSANSTHVMIGPIALDVSSGYTHFGTLDEEAEAADLDVGGVALGKRDKAVLLTDGTVIEEPESDLDNDELEFRMPDEEVEVLLIVGR
ncbi:MAG: hypothetical protein Q8O88_01185 [bacterium]|nr:hypothetical protein [bacterium]